MSTRTVTNSSGVWEVRSLGDGVEEMIKVGGFGKGPEFRVFGPSALVDRPSAPAASRSRPARRRSARARATATPVLDRVVLRAQARQAIVEELCAWDAGEEFESRETGGHLTGWLDGTTLVVNWAHGPGPDAVRALGMLSLDLEYSRSVLHACTPRETIIGLWHSHPDRPDPSRADLKHWAGEARWFSERGFSFREPLYVGLIATTRGKSWLYPRFHCWLSRGDDQHAAQIELEEERWRQ